MDTTGSKYIKKWEVWTQRDGTEVSVGDMTEQHLRNTLNLILKARRERIERLFKEEALRNIRDLEYIHDWRKD